MLLYGEAGRKRPAALIDIYSPTVTAASNAVDESHTALRSLGTYLLPDLHAYLAELVVAAALDGVTLAEHLADRLRRELAGVLESGGSPPLAERSLDPARNMPEHDAHEAAAKIRELVPRMRGNSAEVVEEFRRATQGRKALRRFLFPQSGRPDSNRRPSAWEAREGQPPATETRHFATLSGFLRPPATAINRTGCDPFLSPAGGGVTPV